MLACTQKIWKASFEKSQDLGGGAGQAEPWPLGGHRNQSARLQGPDPRGQATGMARDTVHVGLRELEHTADATGDHQRVAALAEAVSG